MGVLSGKQERRYPKSFVSKLSDAESEAAETQVWLDYALALGYISEAKHDSLFQKYNQILGMLVNMMKQPHKWLW